MIEIQNLSKGFPKKDVLENVNLTIPDGKIFGLVGINGSGKSTLLRVLAGIYKADTGTVTIDGEEVFDNKNKKKEIFFLQDEPIYNGNDTPKTIIELYKALYDTFDENKYFQYIENFKLDPNAYIRTFSKGMKRQVFVSIAMATCPRYILFDESFDGLDPLARLTFKKAVIELTENKDVTVLITSHSLRELEDLCDSYALIDNKNIVTGGINDGETKYHKYQIAFDYSVEKIDFPVNILKFTSDGRVTKVVTTLGMEEFSEKIKIMNPLFIDEISIDFEEMFIIEVESRGYVK